MSPPLCNDVLQKIEVPDTVVKGLRRRSSASIAGLGYAKIRPGFLQLASAAGARGLRLWVMVTGVKHTRARTLPPTPESRRLSRDTRVTILEIARPDKISGRRPAW